MLVDAFEIGCRIGLAQPVVDIAADQLLDLAELTLQSANVGGALLVFGNELFIKFTKRAKLLALAGRIAIA